MARRRRRRSACSQARLATLEPELRDEVGKALEDAEREEADRVERLRALVASGSYRISTEMLADRIMARDLLEPSEAPDEEPPRF